MIKALRYLWLALFLTHVVEGYSNDSISFSQTTIRQALFQARKTNKPVLLFCYASWCPHCKYMKEEVFSQKEVADYFNKTFICISQDMEKGEGIELNKEVRISSFPTFIFYNPNGTIIYRVEGELRPDAFIQEGHNALTPQKQLPYLKQQFEKDMSNSNNCYVYLRALKKGGMDYSLVTKEYFATQNDNQLLSEVNWRIISNGESDINSREMQFVIHHQAEFGKIASPLRVKRKFDYEVKELLNPLVEISDTMSYRIKRKLAAQIHIFSTDSLIFNYDLKIAASTGNWNMYCQTCLQFTDKFVATNHSQLNEIAANFLKHISDKKALSTAEIWAQKSLTLDEEYDTYILCSKLNKKVNNIPQAIKMAKKAKQLSVKYGWEGTEADKLLKELSQLNE